MLIGLRVAVYDVCMVGWLRDGMKVAEIADTRLNADCPADDMDFLGNTAAS